MILSEMAHKRIAILWTIVIVFISQLFHCAYTNQREHLAESQPAARPLPAHHVHLRPYSSPAQVAQPQAANHHHSNNDDHDQYQSAAGESQRETYEELLSSGSNSDAGEARDNTEPLDVTTQQSVRDRCRELISLTLLSFKDLSPDERASEEIDCANLRERIREAAATASSVASSTNINNPATFEKRIYRSRQRQQQQPPPSSEQDDVDQQGATQSSLDNQFPLTPIYQQPPQVASSRQNTRQFSISQQQSPARNFGHFNLSSSASSPAASQNLALGWPPRGGSYAGQMQQLLVQQHRQQQQLYQQMMAAAAGTTTTSPTTTLPATTTFEPLFETTQPPTTTTTTTTTPAPVQPRIRIGGRKPARRQQGPKLKSTTSTTTTTTTTTTAKPLSELDYEPEGSAGELSTDYTDYYDEQTTTTTTTTQRPNHRAGGRGGRKLRGRHRTTSSTTPKPSTTTTTLSPGYQQRPDGRVIDYMADPNLPRELKGTDLTNYPFYITVPEKIDFECKGRHDGYYTNIDLHCQIYHHCAVGNRYDFLCPNYTLFDQTTFTCRFVNTVDCAGSTKHFDRNNALYVEKDESSKSGDSGAIASSTSSTTSTTTTSTTQAPQPRINIQLASNRNTNRELTVSALSIVQQARAKATGSGSASSDRNKER